ncbi:MAG: 3-isopropylmalate dehydratase large subunit [Saprospiraceae bacterium]|nr:3-isopropylmalate dehydratase large subunit [Saprospiraceae bacterium]
MPVAEGLTYFDKVWNDHIVSDLGHNTCLLHVDRHFLHELSGAMSFKGLSEKGHKVRNAELTFATVDHVVDTVPGRSDLTQIPNGTEFIRGLRQGCRQYGVPLYDLGDDRQGIVHVISPELGLALPGTTLVCGDSHTCTVGGVGTIGFGVGSTDGEVALTSQCVILTKPRNMRVNFDGALPSGVYPKDLILYLIGQVSAKAGVGFAVEFAGEALRSMSIEGRLSICNMAVEMSARTGFIAPDSVTYEYLNGKPFAPQGALWDRAVAYWDSLRSDEAARFDEEISIDCSRISPQVTWGTSPEHVINIDNRVPGEADDATADDRADIRKAFAYTRLQPGMPLEGLAIDGAFIGSCTNSRFSDLEVAASILRGRKVAPHIQAICTPGSMAVKRRAEAAGIADIFKAAGFEWREPGCSLCMSGGAGGESFVPGARIISSTNRNFEHRQGKGVISHLASPATVAWSAVEGKIADVRKLVQ